MNSVYVAAPYADAPFIRDHVHSRLRRFGFAPTSTWAESASGSEDFSRQTADALSGAAEANDRDILRSRAVLVVARDGAGGEMFAEARFALLLGLPVVWVGRRILSAWRPGVTRVEDLDEALEALGLLTFGKSA